MDMFNGAVRVSIKAGERFFQRNDTLTKIYLIIKGQASAEFDPVSLKLDAGSVAGVMDISAGKYLFDYVAQTDMTVLAVSLKDESGIRDLFQMGKNYQEFAMTSMLSQLEAIVNVYQSKFASYADQENEKGQQSIITPDFYTWNYLKEISNMEKALYHQFFTGNEIIPYMHIKLGTTFAVQVYRAMEQLISVYGIDTFKESEAKQDDKELNDQDPQDLLNQILNHNNSSNIAAKLVQEVRAAQKEVDPKTALEEMKGALDKILTYSGVDLLQFHKIKSDIEKYRKLPDKTSSDNDVRSLRKAIAEHFYDIYERSFLKSVHEEKVSRLIEMFLTFGFMDERDFSEEQMLDLYNLKQQEAEHKYRVFTIYDWLKAIYQGEREPSKSEMDVDYKENLREMKRTKHFTQQEENTYLTDQEAKVRFEIHNMIRTTSKITSGMITVFCPILEENQLAKSVEQMYLSAERIEASLDYLIDVDYSIFYREQMYYDATNKIDNILVMKQILPDIILMPNVGSRGIMWQEISEKKRDTPARFILPEFMIGNLDDTMTNVVAAFRWEMCRTIQGNYWNDIRDHSLTSEYCDYVQFYKKNKDLSDEVKEKVYAQFKSCRNSAKEMFIKDYESWIKYESKGSLRLNKAVRKILFMYCPFAKKYREVIQKQPIYEEAAARFTKQRLTKVRELKSFHTNVLKRNGKITDILEENLAFYESM